MREIVSYIARDSPDRACRFGNTLIDKALSIETFPEMGQIVLEVGDPSVREIVHGSYRIIYEGHLISTRANQAELKRFHVELGFICRGLRT